MSHNSSESRAWTHGESRSYIKSQWHPRQRSSYCWLVVKSSNKCMTVPIISSTRKQMYLWTQWSKVFQWVTNSWRESDRNRSKTTSVSRSRSIVKKVGQQSMNLQERTSILPRTNWNHSRKGSTLGKGESANWHRFLKILLYVPVSWANVWSTAGRRCRSLHILLFKWIRSTQMCTWPLIGFGNHNHASTLIFWLGLSWRSPCQKLRITK